MDSKLEEETSVIKVLIFEGVKPCQNFQTLQKFFFWVLQFRDGRISVRDMPWPGRLSEAVSPTVVAYVAVFINKDSRMTLQEVAIKLSICKASAYQILHEK